MFWRVLLEDLFGNLVRLGLHDFVKYFGTLVLEFLQLLFVLVYLAVVPPSEYALEQEQAEI